MTAAGVNLSCVLQVGGAHLDSDVLRLHFDDEVSQQVQRIPLRSLSLNTFRNLKKITGLSYQSLPPGATSFTLITISLSLSCSLKFGNSFLQIFHNKSMFD